MRLKKHPWTRNIDAEDALTNLDSINIRLTGTMI